MYYNYTFKFLKKYSAFKNNVKLWNPTIRFVQLSDDTD
jgi:hypothetical protein